MDMIPHIALSRIVDQGILWAEMGISAHNICKFSDESTCTLKKAVKEISCGFKVFYSLYDMPFSE